MKRSDKATGRRLYWWYIRRPTKWSIETFWSARLATKSRGVNSRTRLTSFLRKYAEVTTATDFHQTTVSSGLLCCLMCSLRWIISQESKDSYLASAEPVYPSWRTYWFHFSLWDCHDKLHCYTLHPVTGLAWPASAQKKLLSLDILILPRRKIFVNWYKL